MSKPIGIGSHKIIIVSHVPNHSVLMASKLQPKCPESREVVRQGFLKKTKKSKCHHISRRRHFSFDDLPSDISYKSYITNVDSIPMNHSTTLENYQSSLPETSKPFLLPPDFMSLSELAMMMSKELSDKLDNGLFTSSLSIKNEVLKTKPLSERPRRRSSSPQAA